MESVGELTTRRIGVIGRGLIGGSIALALARLRPAPDVVTLDRGDDLGLMAGVGTVFLAAPISENIRLLESLPTHIPGEAVISDTGSTKRTTVAAAEMLPARLRFVGGHPVTGAASSGAAAARGDLFEGRPWILTPAPSSRAEDVGALTSMIESLGAVVSSMAAEEHDRILAYVSHLPQLTVSALMQTVGSAVGDKGLAVAGGGLRDSSRLAASPASLWQDIVESNADHVETALDQLIATLQRLRRDHAAALPRIFDESARWKQVLEEGHRS